CMVCVFFFSSRRRHTRSLRDWSSDVCSSDLSHPEFKSTSACPFVRRRLGGFGQALVDLNSGCERLEVDNLSGRRTQARRYVRYRSEERRVGKEGRVWWAADEWRGRNDV